MNRKKVKKAAAVKMAGTKNHESIMDGSTLYTYLKEINKIPLLSKEEELRVARLAVKGDKAAQERLVNSNLRFVVMTAKKYQGNGLSLDDLVGEGNLGLMNALKNFDPEKGCRFITYAVWWIRQSISRALNEKSRMIRLPSNKNKELAKIERTKLVLQDGSNIKAEIHEIAEFLNISLKKAADLLKISQNVCSLDDFVSANNNSLRVMDLIEDDESPSSDDDAMNNALKMDLIKAIDSLDRRDADIIRSRYGLGEGRAMTLKEVGKQFNLTRERVRQIEARALRQLQESSHCKELKSYIA